ncbi:hypothetical protein EDD37DRAFT_329250 [Exophiala viscosa]|uniref:uncharacterized protein n=1 Tax=Exophiala viscosa TaxID=2486360 RepID=UPI00218E58F9|nr:hypothetical protein EDD37DRAFT_329250 [Exophiala viscosa]
MTQVALRFDKSPMSRYHETGTFWCEALLSLTAGTHPNSTVLVPPPWVVNMSDRVFLDPLQPSRRSMHGDRQQNLQRTLTEHHRVNGNIHCGTSPSPLGDLVKAPISVCSVLITFCSLRFFHVAIPHGILFARPKAYQSPTCRRHHHPINECLGVSIPNLQTTVPIPKGLFSLDIHCLRHLSYIFPLFFNASEIVTFQDYPQESTAEVLRTYIKPSRRP